MVLIEVVQPVVEKPPGANVLRQGEVDITVAVWLATSLEVIHGGNVGEVVFTGAEETDRLLVCVYWRAVLIGPAELTQLQGECRQKCEVTGLYLGIL